jgi:hypothetical protein
LTAFVAINASLDFNLGNCLILIQYKASLCEVAYGMILIIQSHYINQYSEWTKKAHFHLPLGAGLATFTCFFSSFSTALAFPLAPLTAGFLGGIIMTLKDLFSENILDTI